MNFNRNTFEKVHLTISVTYDPKRVEKNITFINFTKSSYSLKSTSFNQIKCPSVNSVTAQNVEKWVKDITKLMTNLKMLSHHQNRIR